MADEQLELQQKYAWDWFSYHASQRLTAFNFFLVLMGAVIVGLGQALSHDLRLLDVALGVVGGLIAVAFWALDVRNEELVYRGRDALDAIEPRLGVSILSGDDDRAKLGEALEGRIQGCIYRYVAAKQSRLRWFTHSRWLRIVILTMGLLSAAVGILAAAGVGK